MRSVFPVITRDYLLPQLDHNAQQIGTNKSAVASLPEISIQAAASASPAKAIPSPTPFMPHPDCGSGLHRSRLHALSGHALGMGIGRGLRRLQQWPSRALAALRRLPRWRSLGSPNILVPQLAQLIAVVVALFFDLLKRTTKLENLDI